MYNRYKLLDRLKNIIQNFYLISVLDQNQGHQYNMYIQNKNAEISVAISKPQERCKSFEEFMH